MLDGRLAQDVLGADERDAGRRLATNRAHGDVDQSPPRRQKANRRGQMSKLAACVHLLRRRAARPSGANSDIIQYLQRPAPGTPAAVLYRPTPSPRSRPPPSSNGRGFDVAQDSTPAQIGTRCPFGWRSPVLARAAQRHALQHRHVVPIVAVSRPLPPLAWSMKMPLPSRRRMMSYKIGTMNGFPGRARSPSGPRSTASVRTIHTGWRGKIPLESSSGIGTCRRPDRGRRRPQYRRAQSHSRPVYRLQHRLEGLADDVGAEILDAKAVRPAVG